MSRRLHEFARRIAALSDIEEIVTAMRSLAFVELRRLVETIAHQHETLAARERAIADLLAHFPQPWPETVDGGDVLLAVGSERGFCGDFNTRTAAALEGAGGPAHRLLALRSGTAPSPWCCPTTCSGAPTRPPPCWPNGTGAASPRC